MRPNESQFTIVASDGTVVRMEVATGQTWTMHRLPGTLSFEWREVKEPSITTFTGSTGDRTSPNLPVVVADQASIDASRITTNAWRR